MTRFRSIGTETNAGAEIQSIGMDASRIPEAPPLLGCIADDFTGATDLSGTLVKNGVRTVQMMGVPQSPPPRGIDAIVVALKSRSIAREEAVALSLDALAWLRSAGCRQFLFKYCSTFDSTEQGNIGPVAEALMDKLGTDFTIFCPSFPANGRTVFQGHLFVGRSLLSESGMENHPLNPMLDSSLVRLLQRQTKRTVGLIDYSTVRLGCTGIRNAFAQLQRDGVQMAIADAVCDQDLREIGLAAGEIPLVTGGSGIAIGLAARLRQDGMLLSSPERDPLPKVAGLSAVISGSCSQATQRQVAIMRDHAPSFQIDPLSLASGVDQVDQAMRWASERLQQGPVLVYATTDAAAVKNAQTLLGAKRAGALIEKALADLAVKLVDAGVRRLIVAGGETAGAVLEALGVRGLRIGPEIDPGVPWTFALGERTMALALKSGNFGTPDFFLKAWSMLP